MFFNKSSLFRASRKEAASDFKSAVGATPGVGGRFVGKPFCAGPQLLSVNPDKFFELRALISFWGFSDWPQLVRTSESRLLFQLALIGTLETTLFGMKPACPFLEIKNLLNPPRPAQPQDSRYRLIANHKTLCFASPQSIASQ